MIRLTGLYRYPVKSCAGTALTEAAVGARGIAGDRELMVVTPGGQFVTQRTHPRLALVRPALDGDTVVLDAPGLPALSLAMTHEGPARPVRIWRDTCLAVDQGEGAADWFGRVLGEPCRVVRMAPGFRRPVDRAHAVRAADEVGFADGYPFLLVSEESLADLNGRLAAPVPMNRFRPNIVIAGGGEPFVEDRIRRLRIGDLVLHAVKPCARCAIPATDQATAVRGPEPTATLAAYRRRDGKVFFGQNLIHAGPGVLRVGEAVEILE